MGVKLIPVVCLAAGLAVPSSVTSAAELPGAIMCEFPAMNDQPAAKVVYYLAAIFDDGSSEYRNLSASLNQVKVGADGVVTDGPKSCKGKNASELDF